MEPERHGYSPYQIVLGKSPSLPGVLNGDMKTDSIITESDALRQHFDRQEKARILFRQADCSRRLKDAEAARIQPYHDRIYQAGDKIDFLDKDDQWDGPAIVQGTESKTIFVSHNGQMKKVAVSRARPYNDGLTEIDEDIDTEVNADSLVGK